MSTTTYPAHRAALASPRSSTSSVSTTTTALGPLTPGLDSEEGVLKMVDPEATDGEVEEETQDELAPSTPPKGGMDKAQTPRRDRLEPPSAQFAAFSFGGSSKPPAPSRTDSTSTTSTTSGSNGPTPRPYPSPTGPRDNFSFGTCPTDFLGTPTAEFGQFEYPVNPFTGRSEEPPSPGSARSSLSKAVPLGESHRRGSIIARPTHSRSSSGNSLSPPPTRRSSTLSSIATIPAAGQRPSILHSASAAIAQPTLTPFDPHASISPIPAVPSNPASRRGSLLFQPKNLPSPIPPSLLARRGSLPAAQLMGLPSDQHITLPPSLFPGPNRKGSISTYPMGGHTTTTHALYNRRESTFSESSASGASSGSSQQTVREGEGWTRRSSMTSTSTSNSPLTSAGGSTGSAMGGSYNPNARRASLPHLPSLPREGPLFTGKLPQQSNAATSAKATASPVGPVSQSPRASVSFHDTAHAHAHAHASGGAGTGSLAAERRRRSSARASLISHTSGGLSSSEESNEEAEASDGLGDLPTPELESSGSFTNPWGAAVGATDAAAAGAGAGTDILEGGEKGESE